MVTSTSDVLLAQKARLQKAEDGFHKTVNNPDASAETVTAAKAALLQTRTSLTSLNVKLAARLIPDQLPHKSMQVYQKLLKIRQTRLSNNIPPPAVVVFTDLGKDYDDLTAMLVYKEFHRLGLVDLRGVIANYVPAQKRADFARGALDSLGLGNIPVAVGSRGILGTKDPALYPYEFKCEFMAPDGTVKQDGESLLFQLCKEAIERGEKVTALCLSSLEDISSFARKFPNLLRRTLAKVVLQGGYEISPTGELQPSDKAANNYFNLDAARSFHHFMQSSRLPSIVYTRDAAFAIKPPLRGPLFADLAKFGNPIGKHLNSVMDSQSLQFYLTACGPEDQRFKDMDQVMFLKSRTTWYDTHNLNDKEEDRPKGEEVLEYCKIIVYDALAALGAAGDDVINGLDVLLKKLPANPPSIHQLIGDEKAGFAINPSVMSNVLDALLRGSIRSVEQGMASNPLTSF